MAVSKRLRYEVLRRDGHTCKYCGGTAPDVALTVDHVVPVTLGGSDDPANLVAACKDCNAGKSASNPDSPLVADVSETAAQYALAMQVVVEQRLAELREDRKRIRRFDKHWQSWKDGTGEPLPRDGNWKNSITRFLAHGLDDEFLRDAVDTAAGNRKIRYTDVWRYFCGICHRELDAIRDRTIASLEDSRGQPALAREPATLPADFDGLNLAAYFIPAVLYIFAGITGETDQSVRRVEQIEQHVSEGFWAGMAAAYEQFVSTSGDGAASDRADVLSALRAAAMPYMAKGLTVWHEMEAADGEE